MKAGKSHYQVLDIPVSASMPEIKKAYRSLALIFHPDKYPDSIIAIAKFNEIKEAYQVLADPSRRREYDREFLFQKFQDKQIPLASEADEVLQLTKALWAKLKNQDPFRLDQDLLYFQLTELLSSHNIRLLNNKGNALLDQEILQYLMDCSMALPLNKKRELAQSWQLIARNNPSNKAGIQTYLKHAQIWTIWDNHKMALAILVSILVCIFIINQ